MSGKGAKAKEQKAAAGAAKAAAAGKKKEEEEAAAWSEGTNTRALKKQQAEAEAAAAKEKAKREKEALLAKEEEELKGLRKLRGADKVAARKTQAATEGAEDRSRVAVDAPTLTGRGLDAAIAVMTVAMGGAALSPSASSPARGGAGDGDDDAAAEHARDVAAVALLAAGIDADDKHPEKRAKAAFKRFSERELEELKAEFPTLRRSQLQEMIWRKWQKAPENPLNQPNARLGGT